MLTTVAAAVIAGMNGDGLYTRLPWRLSHDVDGLQLTMNCDIAVRGCKDVNTSRRRRAITPLYNDNR